MIRHNSSGYDTTMLAASSLSTSQPDRPALKTALIPALPQDVRKPAMKAKEGSSKFLALSPALKKQIKDIKYDIESQALLTLDNKEDLDLDALKTAIYEKFCALQPGQSKKVCLSARIYIHHQCKSHDALDFSLKDKKGEMPKNQHILDKMETEGTLVRIEDSMTQVENLPQHKPLGIGGGGTVRVGHNLRVPEDSDKVAVKCMTLDDSVAGKMNRNELKQIPHLPDSEEVLKPDASADFGDHGYAVMPVMEYGDGLRLGKLLVQIRKIRPDIDLEPFVRTAAFSMIKGLGDMHDKALSHGDFKLENILLGKKGLKITDFGRTSEVADISKPSNEKTPYVDRWVDKRKRKNTKEDWFALGMSLYGLATGVLLEEPEIYSINSVNLDKAHTLKGETLIEIATMQLHDNPYKRKTRAQLLELPYFKDQVLLSKDEFVQKQEELLGLVKEMNTKKST